MTYVTAKRLYLSFAEQISVDKYWSNLIYIYENVPNDEYYSEYYSTYGQF